MKKITVSIVTMLSLALASPLFAADQYKGAEAGSMQTSQMQSQQQVQSADRLLGLSVVAQDGEDIGQIQDIKLDTSTGRIKYVTVQKGGVMGIGGEEGIAVPLEAFQFTNENAQLTVDKTKLDNAPKQTDLTDEGFQRELESHYGISPVWQEGQGSGTQQMDMNKQHMDKNKTQQPSQ